MRTRQDTGAGGVGTPAADAAGGGLSAGGAGAAPPAHPALAAFSEPTRTWFAESFPAPTEAQAGAWEAIAGGDHALVVAPTGSGKTLAAFLWALDALLGAEAPDDAERCRVLYISPLKALAADVERNLRSPLVGISRIAARQGHPVRDVRVGMRTGDTPAGERRRFATKPTDILITTPESLFLVLTSAARAGLAGVTTVILDEVHALAGSKRGAHLALSLERLDAMLPRPAQRIGLSATVRPVEEVGRFLAGARTIGDGGRSVRTVQPPSHKEIRIDVEVPVPDLEDLGDAERELDLSGDAAGLLPDARPRTASVWPHVTERVVDIISAHRTTLVFTNSRRGAERLTARINEAWAERRLAVEGAIADDGDGDGDGDPGYDVDPSDDVEGAAPPADPGSAWGAQTPGQSGTALAVAGDAVVARAHHGSMSREERTRIEDDLKAGRLPAVVATSSLELGIDMGSIDVVVQVGAPPSVASELQRIGRAGHQVGAVSHGVVLPTHRGDLLAAAVAAVRGREGAIEHLHIPANPLDVLAQQVVAMLAMDDWKVAELTALVRRAAPYAGLGDASLAAVLDMLAGRYPSEDFAELRPRIVWDRVDDVLSARPGALRLAATSGGTIPDRGLYGVYLAAGAEDVATRGGRRVGELDEEMVYESRVGDTFTLGTSTWRIEDITPDRVLVSPAAGLPGRLPFWRGDAPGRPFELGAALGAMVRDVERAREPAELLTGWGLDEWARDNLLAYLTAQREATGHLSTDHTIVVERFRDELGDWRLVIHTPFGARVHAPWALALASRLQDRFGMDVQAMHADDGIVLRLPDAGGGDDDLGAVPLPGGWPDAAAADSAGPGTQVDLADLLLDPDEVSGAVTAALAGSAHFAARFREAAARALLLPRRRPDRRQPLWQQRHRAAQLLGVAARYPDFPIVLEAVRECLQDDFDVPALADLMRQVAAREIRVLEVTTTAPSPFARSLLFGYVGQFLYDGDAPLAERRAAALTLDPALLGELLGEGLTDLADLLDAGAVADVEAQVGLLTEASRVRDAEGAFDLVRRLGPVPAEEVARRALDPEAVPGWLADLERQRRIIAVRVAGREQWSAAEDAGRLRDALGTALPLGLPAAVLESVPDPFGDLVRRHARTHGPFTAAEVAHRFGLAPGAVLPVLRTFERDGTLTAGRLRPAASGASAGSDGVPEPGAREEFCDSEVLRRIRRRSLAALRADVEAVPPATLGVFLPRWQQLGTLRGTDGVLAAVDQLAGARLPSSALETTVLPARVRDYAPAMLDELTSAGEVVWVGTGGSPGGGPSDGTIVLVPTDAAAVLAPLPGELPTELARRVVEVLADGGRFFRDLYAAIASAADGEPPAVAEVHDALWDAVWAGHVTNDTLAPLRARLEQRPSTSSRRAAAARSPRSRSALSRRALMTPALAAAGSTAAQAARIPTPASAAGRWSVVGAVETDPTIRLAATAAALLDRHGVLVRGAVAAEEVPGGFGALYRVLVRLEESGQVRRGYVVEGLGASQFALPECIDRLRADAAANPGPVLLAAVDPANPYGAALPWPAAPTSAEGVTTGARPRRVPGAHVVLVDGALVLYLERGARTLLSFTADDARLRAAAAALANAAASGALGRVVVQRSDGAATLVADTPLRQALLDAGFVATPRGLRVRQVRNGAARARG
ncbi:DEAD/H associated domain protein [Beutenbergia cavernae DSM 12333]|uniref:DEAD/H associated domain protein n=1 Tax=Beutenbergia cavernae (strain ATCC BAA-8 / DSM 12333 / CCUG 43141 / JCM 11478 / NBRC 16432 / NCIMB 13614 / HKI 0122) TaxID=471853 RepID=C5BWN7_BEUC1|nr:DEAD/DEAH box helicase [Beutenbergia cavernae]ACQ80703.1 DEAD/H associated domain protein [Beutenbergia cavernae DSM 12333]